MPLLWLGRMRSLARSQRGSVAAEFAIALPAVVLVLAFIVGTVAMQGRQILLQDAAADAARLIARNEDIARAERVLTAAVADAHLTLTRNDDLVCVTATAPITVVVSVTLTARACALGGGE